MTGSVQATDRLMKELREIYRSDSFKKGEYHFTACICSDKYRELHQMGTNFINWKVNQYLMATTNFT